MYWNIRQLTRIRAFVKYELFALFLTSALSIVYQLVKNMCPVMEFYRKHIKKRRFLQPLRGLRRIFRRKGRPVISAASNGHVDAVSGLRSKENYDSCEQTVEATNLEPARSHSTSQLTDDQIDNSQRRSLQSTLLSVSHDSVFTSEQRSPDSGSETSSCVHTRLGFPHSSVRAELFEAVRRRRAQDNNTSDDEDLGLPRSPVSNSPTTADDMFTKENIVTKSSRSTCSDGSLLSMGSSEIDEESYYQSSRNSSKLSLYEKRTSTGSDFQYNNDRSTNSLNGDASSLSHSAAKHKMAVKPKRNHGAPHKKRQLITSNTLPTTPEVNEENSVKSVASKEKSVADTRHSDEHQTNQNYKTRNVESHTSVTQITGCDHDGSAVAQSKCAVSLSPAPSFKLLTKCKSNVASQPNTAPVYDDVAPDEKEAVGKREDGGASFFSRLLLRRSSKKKKAVVEEAETAAVKDDNDDDHVPAQNWDVMTAADEHVSRSYVKEESPPSMAYMNGGLNNAMKHHPMFRQRVEPLNLPSPENPTHTKISYSSTVPVNMSDDVVVVDGGKRGLQKSHSFRNSEKLPYTCYEDTTPSLPVNIGLAEPEAAAGAKKFSKPFSKSENERGDKVDADVYEPVSFVVEASKWKPTSKVPEYSNISSLNNHSLSTNTLSINVNDQDELNSTPSGDVSVDAKAKPAQIPDVKVPVPAPRTSLLNKSPSITRLSDKDEKTERNETDINVTITEIGDGQKSIISIGGRLSSVTSDVDVEDSVFLESTVAADSSTSTPSADISKVDDCSDDVFLPAGESTRTESSNECAERGEATSDERASYVEPSPEIETVLKADEHEIKELIVPEIAEPAVKPPVLSVKSNDLKSDKIRSKSVTDKQEIDVPLKPLIVPDYNSGTIRVNDTVVIMRKKFAREVSNVKDEEPELMKVFARRSLKLKEPDSVEEILQDVVKSRDSDKENEDANSPLEERKKKDEVVESPLTSPFVKFQRSVSHDAVLAANVNEKRLRCKSIPNDLEKNEPTSCQVEVKIELPVVQEKPMTPFKRIQQRREEWEKRAQQAMKVQNAK